MFRVRRLDIDTLSEHVVFIHEAAVRGGALGFKPLDRVRVVGTSEGKEREITGVLNFCGDSLVEPGEIGLSTVAFADLELPEGASVRAELTPAPHSVDRVRAKLRGEQLSEDDYEAILRDVVAHRYSKVELSMFVLAVALQKMDVGEIVALTRGMITTGRHLGFGEGTIADKHCVGGVPGNRTTMVCVPILAALGLKVPKTSSRAITSPAGTADTMNVLAEVALEPDRIRAIVEEVGACIAWGGALDLAPADDILITVERPMEIDSESQLVASILAKKKTAGATHVLIDIPVGDSAKIRSRAAAEELGATFRAVAREIDLSVEVLVTDARGPIGRGIGPRLEALDVLAVLRREPNAPRDLREKSLYLASRILERTGSAATGAGYREAMRALDSGAAERAFDRIVDAQGRRPMLPEAPHRRLFPSPADGRVRGIDCWAIARVAKLAGAPAHPASGVLLHADLDRVVASGEPLFEIHAQNETQLDFAWEYAARHPGIFDFGY